MRNGHLIAMEGPVTRIVREQSCLLMDAAANNPQWRLPNVFALSSRGMMKASPLWVSWRPVYLALRRMSMRRLWST